MFSVMIPCHRPRADWLRQTIRSVTSQLPAEQVMVVADEEPCADGCTDCLEVANSCGVNFLHIKDEGGVAAHNACIDHATQEMVHLLHPDDWVLPGFYATMNEAARNFPDHALFSCGVLGCDQEGVATCSGYADWLTGSNGFLPLHYGNPLGVAGTVVRRDAYRTYGGWNPSLLHTGDWECWARLTTLGGAVDIRWPLACYRVSSFNHTNRIMKAADNLRDYLRLADVVRAYAPQLVDDAAFRIFVAARARYQADEFRKRHEDQAAVENMLLADELEQKQAA